MGEPLNYWQLIQVDGSGRSHCIDRAEQENFFRAQFPENVDSGSVADRKIQRQLMNLLQGDTEEAKQAEWCLKCYISQALLIACRALVNRHGMHHGFILEELLPLALGGLQANSLNRDTSEKSGFISVSDEVLRRFNPEKSGLSTWCDRILKSNREVKRFLLEHGLELKTNWLILNRASVGKVKRVLRVFDQTERDIEEASDLLQAFHKVYRAEILEPRSRKGGTYPAPDTQHLEAMARCMTVVQGLSPEEILEKLDQLSIFFRQYSVQRLKPPLQKKEAESGPNNELKQLLEPHCRPCLEKAFQVVLRRRIDAFSKRDLSREKDQKSLNALRLFHCEGLSLSQIAPEISLNDQPAVSRLLKLKTLRSDVKTETIKHLKESVLELASSFRSPEALKQLDEQVNASLDEYVTDLMKSAEKKAYTSKKASCQTDNLFSQTLCNVLNNWS